MKLIDILRKAKTAHTPVACATTPLVERGIAIAGEVLIGGGIAGAREVLTGNVRRGLPVMGVCLVLAVAAVAAPTERQQEEWKKRFDQGRALYVAGQYEKALALFRQNLQADANAKGSLLYTALAYIQLGDFATAESYADKFSRLEPANAEGLIAAIKIKQALGKEAEVDASRAKLVAERESGREPRLRVMLSYEREVMGRSDGSRISVLESFEPEGSYVWVYLLLDSDKKTITRRLELAAAPTQAGTYVLGESLQGSYKIYKVYTGLPAYGEARKAAMAVLMGK